jgi:hypothetical protein
MSLLLHLMKMEVIPSFRGTAAHMDTTPNFHGGMVLMGVLIGFLAVFGVCMMSLGARMRESTLRGAGAIRKLYARLGDAIKAGWSSTVLWGVEYS